jgi:opacity protein-like surface antigen
MKYISLYSSLLLALTTATAASALENMYVKGEASYGFTTNPTTYTQEAGVGANVVSETKALNPKVQNLWSLGFGLGYKVNEKFRTELDFSYRFKFKTQFEDNDHNLNYGKLTNYTLMANAYYDHRFTEMVSGYLMAGLGLACNQTLQLNNPHYNDIEYGKTVNKLAWALGAGVSAKVSEKVSVDLGYKFINLGGFKYTGIYSDGTSGSPSRLKNEYTQTITLGVRYSF